MNEEKFYCIDEGQGFDHRCVTFFDGRCSREERCRFQMSETLKKYFAEQWNMRCEKIENAIKEDIVETLGLRTTPTAREVIR